MGSGDVAGQVLHGSKQLIQQRG